MAKAINQQPQQGGYWLIQSEFTTALPVGSRFICDQHQAWLFQTTATSINLLSDHAVAETLSLEACDLIQGADADLRFEHPQLWLGTDLTLACVFDAAKRWQQTRTTKNRFCALLHAQHAFPFTPKPARFVWPIAAQAIGASALLEDWGIAHRLAHSEGLPGCLEGDIIALYQAWLAQCSPEETWEIHGYLPQAQCHAIRALSPPNHMLYLHASEAKTA